MICQCLQIKHCFVLQPWVCITQADRLLCFLSFHIDGLYVVQIQEASLSHSSKTFNGTFLWRNQSPTTFSCIHHLPWLACHTQRFQIHWNTSVVSLQSILLRRWCYKSSTHTHLLLLAIRRWFQELPQNWWYKIKLWAYCLSRPTDSPWS
jgi:hypothetical protein